ncbi:MAG: hypothetical protein ACKOPS_27145, partial [Cyanobium sp.]
MDPSDLPPASRLNLGDAVHDGWTAFCRAPWSFVLYAVLLTGLQILLQPLQDHILRGARGEAIGALDLLLFLFGLTASLAVSCWGNVGMVRGAWQALAGQRPSLGSLLRWDQRGFSRVFQAWMAMGAVLSVPLLAIALVLALAALVLWLLERAGLQLSDSTLVLPGILLAVLVLLLLGLMLLAVLYFSVNQQFLAQVALLEQRAPLESVQRGRSLVDPQWILLLLLLLIKSILMVVGLVTFGVGELLSAPTTLGPLGLLRLKRSLLVGLAVVAGMLVSRLAGGDAAHHRPGH